MSAATSTMNTISAYRNEAGVLVKSYLLASPLVPYTSIFGGVVASKVAYDLTQLISTFYIKPYSGLSKIQRIEWNNRGMSTIHAIFITTLSFYFLLWSDLFSDKEDNGFVTRRTSIMSIFGLGVSVGYFVADIGLILLYYPSLGGLEYIIHHSLSAISILYTMLSGEGQIYCYLCLISELTTPEINLRWYLDTSGLKRSTAYVINGVFIFIFWLVARVVLFLFIFGHIHMHYDQVIQLNFVGKLVILMVPLVLFLMNLMWFAKIIKGLKKTLAKRQ